MGRSHKNRNLLANRNSGSHLRIEAISQTTLEMELLQARNQKWNKWDFSKGAVMNMLAEMVET